MRKVDVWEVGDVGFKYRESVFYFVQYWVFLGICRCRYSFQSGISWGVQFLCRLYVFRDVRMGFDIFGGLCGVFLGLVLRIFSQRFVVVLRCFLFIVGRFIESFLWGRGCGFVERYLGVGSFFVLFRVFLFCLQSLIFFGFF